MSTDLETNTDTPEDAKLLTEGEIETPEELSPDEAFRKKMEAELNGLLDAWKSKFVHVFTAVFILTIGIVPALAATIAAGSMVATLGVSSPIALPVFGGCVALITSLPVVGKKVGQFLAARVIPQAEVTEEQWTEHGGDPKNMSKEDIKSFRNKMFKEMASSVQSSLDSNGLIYQYTQQVLILTKASPTMSGFVLAGAVPVSGIGYVTGIFLPFGLAMFQLGRAMSISLPLILREPKELRIEEDAESKTEEEEVETLEFSAHDVLKELRRTSIYRGQDIGCHSLDSYPFAYSDGLKILKDRYPRLTDEVLEAIGISKLSSSQTQAINSILSEQKLGESRDHVLVGWAGSGRSTLVNLLTLGSLMHREGAVHCVSPEDPTLNAYNALDEGPMTRTPSTQIRKWMKLTAQNKSIQEAYATDPESRLYLDHSPDVVFTDVYKLIEEILAKVKENAGSLLRRLRYVIIDHPHRLSREELIRLRIAISRLRLTTELMGRTVKFIVILPRLNNFAELSKWLLNNDNVDFVQFSNWYDRSEIIGWLPPPEPVFLEPEAPPKFVRADFTKELLEVLIEVGLIIHRCNEQRHLENKAQRPLRVAIIDTLPVLGPEMRAHLSDRVLHAIKEMVPTDSDEGFAFLFQWNYFGTADLNISNDQRYDFIICVGIGTHTEHLVSSLRGALNKDGVMLLMGDSSPSDYESLRDLSKPNWSTWRVLEQANYPKLLIPNHSEAIIAHQLVSLFEDFREQPIPKDRLHGVFPSEHTGYMLQEWIALGLLEEVQVFEQRQANTSPERMAYLRQPEISNLRSEQYEIPWGCCTRDVLSVYDSAAKSLSRKTDYRQSLYIDFDRLFIDYFVHSQLRFSPNTVEITNVELHQQPKDTKGRTRWSMLGHIHARQMDFDEAIVIERRKPRFRRTLVSERPFGSLFSQEIAEHFYEELKSHPLESALKVDDSLDHMDFVEQQRILLASLRKLSVQHANRRRKMRVYGGMWIGKIQESIQDVLVTDARLVEEPDCISIKDIPLSTKQYLNREYECVVASLFFETLNEPREYELGAFNALANMIDLKLRRSFLNFHEEYRVCALPVSSKSISKINVPTHMIPPKKGPTGPYANFDAKAAKELLVEILPDWKSLGADFPIVEVCKILDWMHQNIVYKKDDELYAEREHIADVEEVLRHRAGDCEDHGILMGSLFMAMGLKVRMVLLSDHALCQVYVGPKDRFTDKIQNKLNQGIHQFYAQQAEKHSLDFGRFPYLQGKLAEGWTKDEQGNFSRGQEYTCYSCTEYSRLEGDGHLTSFDPAWMEYYEGEVWLTIDDCMAGVYPGDVSGLEKNGYTDKLNHTWQENQGVRYEYPTTQANVTKYESQVLPYRIAVYRLRQNELYLDEHMLHLLDRQMGYEILPWIHRVLEQCGCLDGCSSCCGVMGSITQEELDSGNYDEEFFSTEDVVSRRKAYELVCDILGEVPNWNEFERGHTGRDYVKPDSDDDDWDSIVDYIGVEPPVEPEVPVEPEPELTEFDHNNEAVDVAEVDCSDPNAQVTIEVPDVEIVEPETTPNPEGDLVDETPTAETPESEAEPSEAPTSETPVSTEEPDSAPDVVEPPQPANDDATLTPVTDDTISEDVGEEPDLPPPPEPEVVEPPPPVLKRNLLERLLWEVTENGLWKKLFNEQMSMEEFELASVQWMEQNDTAWDSALGYYMPSSNEIVLRPSKDRDQLMGTLIHELTHNWQFQSGKFDTQRWMFSSEAQQYYAGSGQSLLVVEGHARFADQMYIFHRGIQSRYKSLNSSDWNEYKVGYLLILGIHQAFGEEGLYRWLRGDTGEPMLRSRNPDLKWGFSLTDALETFGLLYEARTQRFNGIDIKVDAAERELVAQHVTAK